MYSGSRKATTRAGVSHVTVQCSERRGPMRCVDSQHLEIPRRIVGARRIRERDRSAVDREVAPVREHLRLLQPHGGRDHLAILVER